MATKSLIFRLLRAAEFMTDTIRVQSDDFDIAHEIALLRSRSQSIGAIASFIGLMRDFNDGDAVAAMSLEHYAGMTERALDEIIKKAKNRWQVHDIAVIHRVGMFKPGDQIVLVVVAAAHRGAAFSVCEFVMDYLKTQAPFWKKEITAAGERWVESRASDVDAANRWDTP